LGSEEVREREREGGEGKRSQTTASERARVTGGDGKDEGCRQGNIMGTKGRRRRSSTSSSSREER